MTLKKDTEKSEKFKLIQQGAEAKIYLNQEESLIIKKRISKEYRHEELDKKLRKRRTKSETKIMIQASEIINVPCPLDKPGEIFSELRIPYIKGEKLSDFLNNFDFKKQKNICFEIGKSVALLHKKGIIHGDLTTSNMIADSSSINKHCLRIYFIDFGLGFYSDKIEDKAVDLHLLKQALEAKHFQKWEKLYLEVQKGYISGYEKEPAEQVFKRIERVEKRGRYKH
ncbi:MAG TPA: KEOPS complex kinase/ATPase Bud32 [Candidatus Nanoarchaeia archaeon]|nr:KEOPS complex kinase/ATPase Bud32 [Candidatus Nanoarchaeia archaeon]